MILISEPAQTSDLVFTEENKAGGMSRVRKDTCQEYDIMSDQVDLIESPGGGDLATSPPLHMYHTFHRYPSIELDTLHEPDKEGEFEVIVDQDTNLLSLNTYQILSGDQIAHISSLNLAPQSPGYGDVGGPSPGVLTCGGGLEQEGAIVWWRKQRDSDQSKSRWQAEPVKISPENQ